MDKEPLGMSIPSRLLFAVCYFAMLEACIGGSPTHGSRLPARVCVTNESGLTRRFQLRVNGVVAIDTVVGRSLDVTGRVLHDTIWLAAGEQQLVLVDYHSRQQFTAQLNARPGEMSISISLLGPRTDFRAGNYACVFL
jgi:hypothetical protein